YTTIANFAANKMDSATVQSAVPTEGARKTEYDGFVEDVYKFRPNITVSLGLRYDYYGVFHEVNGRGRAFDPITCGGFCPVGSPWYFPDRKDLGPRLAVTWAPAFLHDTTVIRGGYGLYFGEGQLGDLTGPLNNLNTSLALSSSQIPGLSYPIDPFLALAANIAVAPRGLSRTRVNEQINQWGLSAEQKLPGQILLNVGYIGNHGAHLTSRTYLNVLDPITKTRPLPQFGQTDFKKMGNNANFAGLLTSVNRSFSSGLLFTATYLWSHATNDGSTGGGEQDYPQNVACRICERGSSDQDVRSYFTASTVYELPIGHGKSYLSHGATGWILGGIQMSGIALARTGLPLNITISRSSSTIPDGNSSSPQRPDLVPGVSFLPVLGRSPRHWINPAAFTMPASGTFGNSPRNLLRGPGTWQVDLSLQKELLDIHQFNLSFRADGFNLFNHAEYGLPATNLSAGNFGQITTQLNPGATGTGTQRVFQVSLRLTR
ncbi:MAG: TonB-dependent receptor, partial [Acidobacteriaceae bacterium]